MSKLNAKQIEILEEYKKSTQMPCYSIQLLEGEPGILESKLGGFPYLPLGEALPLDDDGEPMALFIQLNLEGTDLPDYPNKGILQVFLSNNGDYPTQNKILYHESIGEHETEDGDQENVWVKKPLKAEMVKAASYMPSYPSGEELLVDIYNRVMGTAVSASDYPMPDDYEEICDELYQLIPMANFGGHGDTTQCEEFDYSNEAIIVKVNSELEDTGLIEIGDCGILWVKIPLEDLKKWDISKAEVGWDCG